MKEHENYLSPLLKAFKQFDSDNDGVVNENEFINIMQTCLSYDPKQPTNDVKNQVEKLLQIIDPYNNQKVTILILSLIFRLPLVNV